MEKVGFQKVEFIGETGFNSTPKTKGALFRAQKPALTVKSTNSPVNTEQKNNKDPNILPKKTRPSTEAVLEKAYAIGCKKNYRYEYSNSRKMDPLEVPVWMLVLQQRWLSPAFCSKR